MSASPLGDSVSLRKHLAAVNYAINKHFVTAIEHTVVTTSMVGHDKILTQNAYTELSHLVS